MITFTKNINKEGENTSHAIAIGEHNKKKNEKMENQSKIRKYCKCLETDIGVVLRKVALKNFSVFIGKQLCGSLSFNKVVPTQVFSCKYCQTFKNTYFEEHPLRKVSSKYRL